MENGKSHEHRQPTYAERFISSAKAQQAELAGEAESDLEVQREKLVEDLDRLKAKLDGKNSAIAAALEACDLDNLRVLIVEQQSTLQSIGTRQMQLMSVISTMEKNRID